MPSNDAAEVWGRMKDRLDEPGGGPGSGSSGCGCLPLVVIVFILFIIVVALSSSNNSRATTPGGGQQSAQNIVVLPLKGSSLPDPHTPAYQQFPEQQVTVSLNTPVKISGSWGAINQTTLDDNWKHMTISFSIDGKPVDSTQHVVTPFTFTSSTGSVPMVAYKHSVTIAQWTPGKHTITCTRTHDSPINDGINTYAPGKYTSEYYVYAK
jgi:hypothetical protein